MTKKELKQVEKVLLKIKNRTAEVEEALCNVARDVVRREQQSKAQKDNSREYDY